jgi:hypothetical protein
LKLGRQAETMPIDGSTEDHMATVPMAQVLSAALEKTSR